MIKIPEAAQLTSDEISKAVNDPRCTWGTPYTGKPGAWEVINEGAAEKGYRLGWKQGCDPMKKLLKRLAPEPFSCRECGPFAASDEFGCCVTCGMDVRIVRFETAYRRYSKSFGGKK